MATTLYVVFQLNGNYIDAFATETDPAAAAVTGEMADLYPLCSIAKPALEENLERCTQFTALAYACVEDLRRVLARRDPAADAAKFYTETNITLQ